MIYFQRKFCVGDIIIEIRTDREISDENRYLLFCDVSSRKADIFIDFIGVDKLPEIMPENLVKENDAFFEEGVWDNKRVRTFFHLYTGEKYAMLIEKSKIEWKCLYMKQCCKAFQDIGSLFYHIAFERIMINNNALVFHSALVEYNGKGILFSGPSGIGKSTQANLWEKCQNSEVINGDKVILKKVDGVWYGYGSPYAGSSEIYKNKKTKITAIVFLDRAKDKCVVDRLNGISSFKEIYSETILNSWNQEYIKKAVSYIYDILSEVDVYKMYALKDVESVKCLKNIIDDIE